MSETAMNLSEAAVSQTAPVEAVDSSTQKVEKTSSKGVNPSQKTNTPEKQGYKLFKVDGSEYEVDEKTYTAAVQKSLTADKRLKEATLTQKKALDMVREAEEKRASYEKWEKMSPLEQFEHMEKKLDDPNISKEFRAKIEQWLWGKVQEEQQSPEIQKMNAAERRAKELEDKLKAREEAEEKVKFEEAKKHHSTQAQKDIIQVLQMSELPPTEWNVKRVADLMYNARQAAKKNPDIKISNEQIATILKEDTIETAGALYGKIADGIIKAKESGNTEEILNFGKSLVGYMPEGILKALRIYDLTKHTSGQPIAAQKLMDAPKATEEKKQPGYQYKNMDHWQEERKRMVADMQRGWKKA